MAQNLEFLSLIRRRAQQRILFLPHAVCQMSRPDRMIATSEVEAVIREGQIIADSPEDARGHSALMVGRGAGARFVHVVCSPKEEYLAIIAAYIPDPEEWANESRERKVP